VRLGGDIFTPNDGWRKTCMLIIGSPIMLGIIGVSAIVSAFLSYLLCTVSYFSFCAQRNLALLSTTIGGSRPKGLAPQ
jgi:hypothetical protein